MTGSVLNLVSILYTIQARTKITADSFYFILEMDELKEDSLTVLNLL